MKSRLNLKPGQKGTKALVERYGEALLYVRYRYDEEGRKAGSIPHLSRLGK